MTISRTFLGMMKITPRFVGTNDERRANVESHNWKRVDLAERYGYEGAKVVVMCQDCNVLASGTAAEYSCETNLRKELPEAIRFDEYMDGCLRDSRSIKKP
jgi:hypothetical protein